MITAYAQLFYGDAGLRLEAPTAIVFLLRAGHGYLYSMYEFFSIESGRELYPWAHAGDSLIPRITGRIGDLDFLKVFESCDDLVLYQGELAGYPRSLEYVQRAFRPIYEDAYYVLWRRNAHG
jgi:hypothetical protein